MDVREEPVERVRLGTLARVEVDRQRRKLAAVERLPRRDRRAARIERLLLALRQDVRLLLPRDPEAVRVRLELGRREERVGRGVVEVEPLEIDEEEKALEVGKPVARERREVVRLGVGRLGVLARRRVETHAGDVLVERVELGEEREQLGGADGTDRAAAPLGEVARACEELIPRSARRVRGRGEIVEIPADAGRAEGTRGHGSERTAAGRALRC